MKDYNGERGVFGDPNLPALGKSTEFVSCWPIMLYIALGIIAGFLDWITTPIQRLELSA